MYKLSLQVRDDASGGTIVIDAISGDGGRLSLDADDNCAGIAAKATLELLGVTDVAIALTLEKGLPLGSGLGSSAASAAAAAWAVNALFGGVLTRAQLVEAGLVSEATVSGYHADNIAPAIMGGFVLVRSYNPLQLIPLQVRPSFKLSIPLAILPYHAGSLVCAPLTTLSLSDMPSAVEF
jgi:homoserine kinase